MRGTAGSSFACASSTNCPLIFFLSPALVFPGFVSLVESCPCRSPRALHHARAGFAAPPAPPVSVPVRSGAAADGRNNALFPVHGSAMFRATRRREPPRQSVISDIERRRFQPLHGTMWPSGVAARTQVRITRDQRRSCYFDPATCEYKKKKKI